MNLAAELLARGRDEATALVADGVPTTYAQLRRAVAQAAGAWRTMGVNPGERVVVALADDAAWVAAFLGAIFGGAVAVALNPRLAPGDRDALAAEGRYAAWLGEDGTPAPVVVAQAVSRSAWQIRVDASAAAAAATCSPEMPAFWLYSSGTTGLPKAVVHAHRVVPAVARCGIEVFGIDASDRLFAPSRLFFAYPLANSLFTGLACGATVILQREWPTVDNVTATAARDRPTVFFGVPAFCRALLHEGRAGAIARGLRVAVSAGEAMAPALAEQWRIATGVPTWDGYGTSETLALMLVGRPQFGAATVLRSAPGVTVASAIAEAGLHHLTLRAPTVALGYRNREAEERVSFGPAGFTPGDRFAPAGDGWHYAGRADTLVKVRGRWVSLPDVEAAIAVAAGPAVREIALIALADGDGLTTLAAAYVSDGDELAASAALQRALAPLPPYQRPTRCVAFDALPRTVTGKLLRRELVARLEQGAST
jgi:acyl-coenzyme A synthetase/AMP-(fatty) acid ligase